MLLSTFRHIKGIGKKHQNISDGEEEKMHRQQSENRTTRNTNVSFFSKDTFFGKRKRHTEHDASKPEKKKDVAANISMDASKQQIVVDETSAPAKSGLFQLRKKQGKFFSGSRQMAGMPTKKELMGVQGKDTLLVEDGRALDVEQFEGRLGEYVQLDVTWTVTGRQAKETLLVKKAMLREPVATDDYEALVAAKSRVLATLSRKIADEIRKLLNAEQGENNGAGVETTVR